MKKARLLGFILGVMTIFVPLMETAPAAEKKYPTKPIQVIVPFAPGETDNLLRPFIESRVSQLGAQVNVLGPAEHAAFLKGQYDYYDKVYQAMQKK